MFFCVLSELFLIILLTGVGFSGIFLVFQLKRALSRMALRLPVELLHTYDMVVRDGFLDVLGVSRGWRVALGRSGVWL